LLLALALVLSGCGGSAPNGRGVKETVSEFLRAAAARDGASACAVLSDAGRAAMASYPKRPTAGTASSTACAHRVEQLDRLPAARQWAAMAAGDITVDSGAGLDAQPVTVSYQQDAATRVQTGGSATPPALGSNSQIVAPPFPVGTQ
jgi:hypothetical protein